MWMAIWWVACGDPAADDGERATTDAAVHTDERSDGDSGTVASTHPVDVQVCGPTPFPDRVERIHTCPEPCDGSLESCSWDTTAETGWPSRSVGLVAAGRGAVIRYSEPGVATLFVHNGGTGTTTAPRVMPDAFVAAGGRVVEVVWHVASSTGAACEDADCGWLTRPLDAEPSSIVEVSSRPAAVLRWAHDALADDGAFGTVSCSAGSLATFYARTFYDLDPRLDYQMLLGGPLLYSAEWGCSGRPTGCGGGECGRCRTDPSVLCEVGAPGQCAGAGATCSSYRLTGSIGLLDVLYLNRATCPQIDGTDYATGDLATSPGDTDLEHPVDIVLSTNLVAQFGDDDIGVLPNAYDVFQALSGPDVTLSYETGPHCGTFAQAATCERVLTRMGLGASAAVHCAP